LIRGKGKGNAAEAAIKAGSLTTSATRRVGRRRRIREGSALRAGPFPEGVESAMMECIRARPLQPPGHGGLLAKWQTPVRISYAFRPTM